MPYDPDKTSSRQGFLHERASEFVRLAIGVGLFLSAAGAFLGLWIAVERQGAGGLMLVILSLMLGILTCLAGVVAIDVVDRDSRP
ncbi:hypothetical protein BH09ACT10_BH09ACT10_10260 [soil metagenome]